MVKVLKIILPFVFLSILTLPAYKILLSQGYFPMHDDTQPSRVFEMAKALSYGQFPVRLVPDLGYGYGYPIFNFYAPLPYYIGSLIYFVNGNIIDATKMMFLTGFILAGISMYFLGKEIGGRLSGLVASVLYVYAPYHAVILYVRGAVGELYAYGILPFVILAIIKIIKGETKHGLLIGSLSIAAVLLSHNILALIMLFFLFLFLFIYSLKLLIGKNSLQSLSLIAITIILGIGLSAFFTFPAILESPYTRVKELTAGGSNYKNHFVTLDQLWDSPWGYGGSAKGKEDGMSFKIGKAQIMTFILVTLFLPFSIMKKSRPKFMYIFLPILCLLFLSIFFMTDSSRGFWEIIPLLPYIQYPWRFLTIALLALSIFASLLPLLTFKKRASRISIVAVITLYILVSTKYFSPQYLYDPNPLDYIAKESLNFRISRISDEYLPKELSVPQIKDDIPEKIIDENQGVEILKLFKETPTEKKYLLKNDREKEVSLNIAFFPGWKGLVQDKSLKPLDMKGKLVFVLPEGENELTILFSDTPTRKAANIISFLSLILVVYVTFNLKILSLGRNPLPKDFLIWPKGKR